MLSKMEILEMKEVLKSTGRSYGGKVNVVDSGFLDFAEKEESLEESFSKLPVINRFTSTPERKIQSDFASGKLSVTSNIDYKLKHPSVFKTHPSSSETDPESKKRKPSIFCCCLR